jgi:oligosaccharide repeat unit polymerase
MPSSMNLPDLSIATQIKKTWYLSSQGGGLPPTCIGEMYVNFGAFGVIVGMFLIGIIFASFYNIMMKYRNRSYWITLIYASILTRFIFIYPKGELSNFSSSVWLFLPTIITITIIRLMSR